MAGRFEGLPDVHYGKDEYFVAETAGTGISKWTLTGTRRDDAQVEVCDCDFCSFGDGKVVGKDSC